MSRLIAALVLVFLAPAALAHASDPSPEFAKRLLPVFRPGGAGDAVALAGATNDLTYHGGDVQKVPKVYLVFWGWHGIDPKGEASYLVAFFSGVGGSPWANVQTQYSDTTRGFITNPPGQLGGVWWDDDLTWTPAEVDLQIASEALRAADHFGYDADANYVIALPTLRWNGGFGTSYCAWHSSELYLAQKPIAYTDLPYVPDMAATCGANSVNGGSAGALDGVSIVAGHEYSEAVTDPHPSAAAWMDAGGQENGDKCAWQGLADVTLSTGRFAVQPTWSNAIHGCALS